MEYFLCTDSTYPAARRTLLIREKELLVPIIEYFLSLDQQSYKNINKYGYFSSKKNNKYICVYKVLYTNVLHVQPFNILMIFKGNK